MLSPFEKRHLYVSGWILADPVHVSRSSHRASGRTCCIQKERPFWKNSDIYLKNFWELEMTLELIKTELIHLHKRKLRSREIKQVARSDPANYDRANHIALHHGEREGGQNYKNSLT